ncbi:MAG: hypothetical protein HQL77_16845 [Magnetococcales bacterium]|nr:hypothetical protein [Magnetococcales bacterium]
MYECLGVNYKEEPNFIHKEPSEWYKKFSSENNVKLRFYDFYNPDFLLNDGTWVEVTLSENTAYKKIFRYGHQATYLKIIWLDVDNGFHKEISRKTQFPNAKVESIEYYYPQLYDTQEGREIIKKLEQLKYLKGIIL